MTYSKYYNLGLIKIIGNASADNLTILIKNKLLEFNIILENHIYVIISDGYAVINDFNS